MWLSAERTAWYQYLGFTPFTFYLFYGTGIKKTVSLELCNVVAFNSTGAKYLFNKWMGEKMINEHSSSDQPQCVWYSSASNIGNQLDVLPRPALIQEGFSVLKMFLA